MQTPIPKHSLKYLPTATAIVDQQYGVLVYSNLLGAKFGNSKNQTESMGGKITVHSTVGKGTTFTLTFKKA